MELKNEAVWRANGVQLLNGDRLQSNREFSTFGITLDGPTKEAVVHYIYKVKLKYSTNIANKIRIKALPMGLGTFYGFWFELLSASIKFYYSTNTNGGSEPS